jgi:NADH dehydrogenase FAD-containing subunit
MPRRLLLLGAGPAHAQLLAAYAREPLASAELALITPDAKLVQPARVPAFVAGRIGADECCVDTATLAAAAGAVWVRGRVEHFDPASRQVTLADGSGFDADVVSIDEPGAPDREALPGAREHALALHPSASFVTLFGSLVTLAEDRPLDLVVIGGGDASAQALELALALAERMGGWGARRGAPEPTRIAWVAGDGELLPGWPSAVRRAASVALAQARITVFREPCRALDSGIAVLRIPLIVDTHSRLIADSVPGDRGHPLRVS